MTTEEQREWRAESFGKGQWRVIEEDAEGGRVKLVLRLGGDRSLAERVARLPALEHEIADLKRQLETAEALNEDATRGMAILNTEISQLRATIVQLNPENVMAGEHGAPASGAPRSGSADQSDP